MAKYTPLLHYGKIYMISYSGKYDQLTCIQAVRTGVPPPQACLTSATAAWLRDKCASFFVYKKVS